MTTCDHCGNRLPNSGECDSSQCDSGVERYSEREIALMAERDAMKARAEEAEARLAGVRVELGGCVFAIKRMAKTTKDPETANELSHYAGWNTENSRKGEAVLAQLATAVERLAALVAERDAAVERSQRWRMEARDSGKGIVARCAAAEDRVAALEADLAEARDLVREGRGSHNPGCLDCTFRERADAFLARTAPKDGTHA